MCWICGSGAAWTDTGSMWRTPISTIPRSPTIRRCRWRTAATRSGATPANLQRHIRDSNLADNIEALREIRATVEKHADRFVFGEFSEGFERSGAYAADGLHASYTFELLRVRKLSPDFVLKEIATLARHPDYWPCVSFCNHDIVRTVTRFGGGAAGDPRLAKLMLALLLTLRGTVLLYQGEELGLPEVDLKRDQLRDPVGDLYYPVAKGRDGCRTPMPWDADALHLGFTSGTPWLPLGETHRPLAVSRQDGDAQSTLNFARAFLAKRKASAALRLGAIEALDAPAPILAFTRTHEGERVTCVLNMSGEEASYEGRTLGGYGMWFDGL